MMCPKCGATQSQVLGTRGQSEPVTERRRECFNGHRFTTYEVNEKLAGTIRKYLAPHKRGAVRIGALTKRDRTIVREVRNGAQMKDVATRHGLSANTVSYIIKKRAPELCRNRRSSNV